MSSASITKSTMLEKINEKVAIITKYEPYGKGVMPMRMRWQGRYYNFVKLGYYHKRREGRAIMHVYDVSDGQSDFRLVCNPEDLHWSLEEVSDGNAA